MNISKQITVAFLSGLVLTTAVSAQSADSAQKNSRDEVIEYALSAFHTGYPIELVINPLLWKG